MSDFSAVIFDLDDTLFPERSFVISGFRAASEYAASVAPIDSERLFRQLQDDFHAGVRGNSFELALRSLDSYSVQLEAAMVEAYRDHEPRIKPFPDVVDILQRLKKEHRIGLLSDGTLEVQQRKFRAIDISRFFDAVVFSDEFGREHWKPSTIPFQAALDRLDVQRGEDAVYVADNVAKDFYGARQLGIRTIWIRRPDGEYTSTTPPTAAHRPDREISALSQLDAAMAEL